MKNKYQDRILFNALFFFTLLFGLLGTSVCETNEARVLLVNHRIPFAGTFQATLLNGLNFLTKWAANKRMQVENRNLQQVQILHH